MSSLHYAVLALAAVATLIAVGALVTTVGLRRQLAIAVADSARVHLSVDHLKQQLSALEQAQKQHAAQDSAVVITDATTEAAAALGATAPGQPNVADRLVLSATLGEPLVKSAAFVYGVRQALSPESRNRIAFEVRREIRRSRKQRRHHKGIAHRATREHA